MRSQPNKNYQSNDNIMTPDYLARTLVEYFRPSGRVLEPCAGTGAFLKYLPPDTFWCEIKDGKDFFDFRLRVDWIFTNPPWSQIRRFLCHSLELADNICFLLTINHLWTKARLRDIKEANFGIKEIVIFDTPKTFPQLGFQMGMIHLQRNYKGDIKFTELRINNEKTML